MKQGRLDNIQVLRGVAAVSIIFEHAFDQFSNHVIAGMPLLRSPIGSLWGNGVDIFFVISGFIMYYLSHAHFAESGYSTEFLKRRILRVVPTYWLFTTLMILISVARPEAVNNGVGGAMHAITSYLFIPYPRFDGLMHPVLGLGWTLNYEFFFYACYAAALSLPARTGLIALVLWFMALACAHPWIHSGIFAFWSNPIILEFLAGVFVAMAYVKGVSLTGWHAALLLILGLLLALTLPHYFPDQLRVVRSGLPSLLIAATLMLTPSRRWWRLAILIGDASYALYLTHPFALNLVTMAWERLSLSREPHLYWLSLVGGSLIAGLLVFLFVERPITTWLRRRFEPKREVLTA